MGHPRGTHSRYVIGCCLIPLGICGLKNNSRRITYGIGCVWGMPSLSPLSSLDHAYYIVYFCGARRSRRFTGIPPKIVISICILAIWLAFWFDGSISFFCGTTAPGRVMPHNKPLRFGMYFQRFLLTQCQKKTLVRSLKINIGRRRRMQAASKVINETFIPYSEIYILLP